MKSPFWRTDFKWLTVRSSIFFLSHCGILETHAKGQETTQQVPVSASRVHEIRPSPSLVFNLLAAEQNYIEFAFAFLPACWPRKLFFLTYRCSCLPAHHKTGPFSEFSKLPWRISKPTHPLPHCFFAISHWFLRCILEKVCLSISLTLTAMKPSFYSLTSVATSFHFN